MSELQQIWQRLLHHIEEPPAPFHVRGEVALAALILPLAFAFQVLDMLYGSGTPGESPAYVILLATFTALAFVSVFVAATPSVSGRSKTDRRPAWYGFALRPAAVVHGVVSAGLMGGRISALNCISPP